MRQVFNDLGVPPIEVGPNEDLHAAELGMWGR